MNIDCVHYTKVYHNITMMHYINNITVTNCTMQ